MSETRGLLKARLDFVRRDLDEAVSRLTQEMVDWAPVEGMRTIGGQLVEIAVTEWETMVCLAEGREITETEFKQLFGDGKSLPQLVEVLATVRSDTLHVLDSLSEHQLEQAVTIEQAWFASFGQPMVPRAEVFRSVALHEWYHVGQLNSYLWARGDNPYQWHPA